MWRSVVLVAVAACGTPSGEVIFQPIQLDVDVVVSPAQVQIYTNNTDGTSGPGSEHDIFPLVETCVSDGDSISTAPSCLTDYAILDGGAQVAHGNAAGFGAVDKSLAVDVRTLGSPTLRLVGCDGEADIPLAIPTLATPTVHATVDTNADAITTTWGNTTAVMLTFDAGLFADRCQTEANPYTFTLPTGIPIGDYHYVDAQALEGPTIVGTELGDVRVWSGGIASAQL